MEIRDRIVQLIKKTAIELPDDVFSALKSAYDTEENSNGKEILFNIIKNCEKAKSDSKPICQDTGTPIFYVKRPKEMSEKEIRDIINEAVSIATNEIPLRPNAVDSISGRNLGNMPVIHFEEAEGLEIDLMLKGGGSENISALYQLPDKNINAFRNLDGVKKCILDAVFKAQGRGCPPYFIGVSVGGSIEETAHSSKEQILRNINDTNPDSQLGLFEKEILKDVNGLGIGPLGLGGNTTALSVKITHSVRHPTTFFVGVSMSCWCLRRGRL